ncbi:exodeoxyribonuclease III [Natronoglycomyces albus]|uniref:exodeoxyribonuclease III n=1 Tax=Natronoglycomyces albus TaxID=2811108 RepID=UPI001BD18169|nr:exodeoxyribonuclease III [Natronoglycomyces albus]
MRIVSWNINSITARADRLAAWIEANTPDVVCLQELKTTTEAFPAQRFNDAGYAVAAHGQGRWNGVAILSRVGLDHIQRDLTDQPAFNNATEARAIAATCNGVRIWSVYVPNGRDITDPHYEYKLNFLGALAAEAANRDDSSPYAITGDFNVCPTDDDIYDIDAWEGTTHTTDAERAALNELQETNLTEVYPRALKYDQPFTFWDYRNLDFPKNRGLRIDLLLANPSLMTHVTDAYVDRNERKGKGASDHAPLVVDTNL